LQVSEASRHEASVKTVLPPIGAVAPVTSVPAGGYAGFSKRLLYLIKSSSGGGGKKTFIGFCISLRMQTYAISLEK
ncbi:MAG: hypothetical protein IIY69_07590, partial [Clostridia bacterium]|nr:hypothetical protein [Clostridia bacterium]